MKEVRLFYAPDAAESTELPADEAGHVARVLRLSEGDELLLTDGKGFFYQAILTAASPKHCLYKVCETYPKQREWSGHLHLAVAPTKNMDRMEWLAEKATEIGFDELSFLSCTFSERKVLKEERIGKILISAMKQSHKAWLPKLNALSSFASFLKQPFSGNKYIAHCYDEKELFPDSNIPVEKPFLFDVLKPGEDALVMVGPEGDFSVEEVRQAIACGFIPVSLGKSRLRTETAALVAVHLMHLKNRN